MDKRQEDVLKDAGVSTQEVVDDYEGVAYDVAIIFEGALDDSWIVATLSLARDQAQAIVDAEEPDEPLEVIISEVRVGYEDGEGFIEPTGYGADETFTPG